MSAQVENNAVPPPGTMPRSIKRLIVAALIAFVVFGLWIKTAKHPAAGPAQAGAAFAPRAGVTPAELKAAGDAIAQKQAVYEQSRMDAARGQVPGGTPDQRNQPPAGAVSGGPQPQQEDPAKVALKEKELLRDFDSPLIVVDAGQQGTDPAPTSQPQAPQSSVPVLSVPSAAGDKPKSQDEAKPGQFNNATGPRYLMPEGTIIEAQLLNRLIGEFAGPVMCQVSADVMSHDLEHVLIPSGTKVIGSAHQVAELNQERLAVDFHRLIFPDYYSVSLEDFTGLDQQGADALKDKVNRHLVSKIGSVLAIGLLGGIAEAQTGSVLTQSGIQRVEQGVGSQSAVEGEQILQQTLGQRNNITIREGTRVKIWVDKDLLVPAWENHRMDPHI